jgi:hypothetical protein
MAHPLSSYSIELGNMEPPRPRKPTFTDLPDDAISSIIEKGLDCTSNSGAYLSRNDFKLLTGFSSISKGVRDVARRVAEEQPAYLKVCVRTRAGMGDEFTGLFPRPAAELPSCLRWLRSAPRVDWLRVEIGGLSPSDTAALLSAVCACDGLRKLELYTDSFRHVPALALDLRGMPFLRELKIAARRFDAMLVLRLSESLEALAVCGYFLVDADEVPNLEKFAYEAPGELEIFMHAAKNSHVLLRELASPATYAFVLTHAHQRGVFDVALPQEHAPLWCGVRADTLLDWVELPLRGDALWSKLRKLRLADLACLPIQTVPNRAGLVLELAPSCVHGNAETMMKIGRVRNFQARLASIAVHAALEDNDGHFGKRFLPSNYVESIHAAMGHLAHLEGSTRVDVWHRFASVRSGGALATWHIPVHITNTIGGSVDLEDCTLEECEALERCCEPVGHTPGRFPAAWREWAGPTASEARACRQILGRLRTDREEVEVRMAAAGVAVLPAWWGSIWPVGDEGADASDDDEGLLLIPVAGQNNA